MSWLASTANVSYTTVCDLANGKTDMEKMHFGTVLRLCNALEMTAFELFDLCPSQKKWTVFLDGNDFYMTYFYGDEEITERICKNNPTNAKYINTIAECLYKEIMCKSQLGL